MEVIDQPVHAPLFEQSRVVTREVFEVGAYVGKAGTIGIVGDGYHHPDGHSGAMKEIQNLNELFQVKFARIGAFGWLHPEL